jgi:hypothetical protein
MSYTYSLPYHAIDDSMEDAIRNLLDGDPLAISLELEEYEIHELLTSQEMIADIWSVWDVIQLRPDLTPEQGWEVLKAVRAGYEPGQGISHRTIHAFARDLFGGPAS